MRQDKGTNRESQGSRRDVVWQALEEPAIEHLVLDQSQFGTLNVTSTVVGLFDGNPHTVTYDITMTPKWHATQLVVGVDNPDRRIDLRSDGLGHWTTGDPDLDQELDGCLDVDVIATPFTNTLPIRRLGLSAGEASEIDVVYVLLPTLEVSRKRQRYTRLAERTWRFESLKDGDTVFSADLEVDADGLVTDYPGLFARLYPASPDR